MSKKPEKLWSAFINIGSGIHTRKPIRMKYDNNLKSWWDSTGNKDASKLGLSIIPGSYATFTSESKKEVEIFISGATTFIKVCLTNYVY